MAAVHRENVETYSDRVIRSTSIYRAASEDLQRQAVGWPLGRSNLRRRALCARVLFLFDFVLDRLLQEGVRGRHRVEGQRPTAKFDREPIGQGLRVKAGTDTDDRHRWTHQRAPLRAQ